MRAAIHRITRWVVAVSMVLAAIFGYASSQLLDEDQFSALVSRSLHEDSVRGLLADKAVDVAIDAADVDSLLAQSLPDELALVATPALELSKPAIAQAGSALLGVDAVVDGLDAAARSVHRQTVTAILADEETDVVINTLPVLVVAADTIAGDVGARAAVGVDLPPAATSINLGSNQAPAWALVRGLELLAGAAVLTWLVALAAFLLSAPKQHRLLAARRLGRTFIGAGIATMILGALLAGAIAVAIDIALSPGDAISFGAISIGGVSRDGGAALAEIMVEPLIGAARRTVLFGLLVILASHLLGKGHVAQAVRDTVRSRDARPLIDATLESLPGHYRRTQQWLTGALVVMLIGWPQITLRVVITLLSLYLLAMATTVIASGTRAPLPSLRTFAGIAHITRTDESERSESAGRARRWILVAALLLAIVWPSYERRSLIVLVVLIALALTVTYRWEGRLDNAEPDRAMLPDHTDPGWTMRRKVGVGFAAAAGLYFLSGGFGAVDAVSASQLQPPAPQTCNGHANLCAVPVNQVVFAGTHNSMSANELGWELANHELAIPKQLAAGVRALLIDVLYWENETNLEALELDPEAARLAAEVLDISAAPEDGLWMCHAACQLGATPFEQFSADLRVFLETNPDDVVIVVIQDVAPAAEIKASIEASMIDQFAYAHEPDAPWPTLAEMIAANQRVLFLAEEEADDDGWYQRAFDGNVSETDFSYAVIEDFDCAPNRGGEDGAFFMVNHWVETGLPIPSEADAVNSREVLTNRIDECIEERDRTPNIIAVNFWERGDLLTVVAELNEATG